MKGPDSPEREGQNPKDDALPELQRNSMIQQKGVLKKKKYTKIIPAGVVPVSDFAAVECELHHKRTTKEFQVSKW